MRILGENLKTNILLTQVTGIAIFESNFVKNFLYHTHKKQILTLNHHLNSQYQAFGYMTLGTRHTIIWKLCITQQN